MTVTLYHNPKCGTSAKAKTLLDDLGVDYETVLYLKEPLDAAALRKLASMLEDPVADLVRKDPFFKKLELDPADYQDVDAVVDLLVEHPRLMQRPIVVSGRRAVIGRPLDRVGELVS